jgi:hypothetical protein
MFLSPGRGGKYLRRAREMHPWHRECGDVHGDTPVEVECANDEKEPPTNDRPEDENVAHEESRPAGVFNQHTTRGCCGDRITATPAVKSHDRSKIPHDC